MGGTASTSIRVIRSLVAVLGGYLVLVLASTFVQEALFGGVSFQHSPISTLVFAGALTPLSAVLAGIVTAAIAGRAYYWHILPLCIEVAVETTYLFSTHRVDGPLWFEGSAGLALVLGALFGVWLWATYFAKSARVSQA